MALARLGLNVTAPEVTWDSIQEATDQQRDKDGSSPLAHETLKLTYKTVSLALIRTALEGGARS